MSTRATDIPARSAAVRYPAYAVATAALIAGALALPTKPILAGFGAMIVIAVLLRARHDAALLILLFLTAVAVIPAPLTFPNLGSLGAPTILIGLGAAAVWGINWLIPQDSTLGGYRPIPLLVAAFVAANLASYAAAGWRPTDAVEVAAADRGIITVAASTGIALLTAEAIAHRDRLNSVIKGVVVATAAIAVVGIIQFATGFDLAARISIPGLAANGDAATFIAERSIFRRVAGTTLHAIEFSVVLCMALPLALHLALHHSRRWYVAVALLGLALPMSVSRSAAVGIVAVLAFVVPGWPRRLRRRFYVGAVGYLVAMRLAIPGLLGTIRALFNDASADPSVASRQTDYDFVNRFVHERPFFGRGFSTFIPTRYDFLDNQYLLSLVETGYVGVAAFIALIGGGMLAARRVRRRAVREVDRDLAQALVASLAVVAVTSAVFDFLSFPSARALLFVVIGCIGALWRLVPRSPPEGPVDDEHHHPERISPHQEASASHHAGVRPLLLTIERSHT